MKYSQFLQLSELLEAKGTTIYNEFSLNEAEPIAATTPTTNEPATTDVEKTNLAQRLTRWGKLKNTLNKNGKKIQNQINVKVLQKYLPQILETELQTVKQVIELSKQDKKPEEIVKLVRNNIKKTTRIQTKQLDIIDTVIDKFLSNAGTELEKKIDASKMKDKNKLDLKNYWLLLKTQIRMNAYTYMQKTIDNKSKEAIGDNKIVLEIMNKIKQDTSTDETTFWGKIFKKRKDTKTQSDKQLEVVKKIEKEESNAGAKTTTSPETTNKPEIGKEYEYNEKDKKYIFKIVSKNDDGSYEAETTDKKHKATIKPDMFNNLVPIKTKEPAVDTKIEGEREPKL